MIDEALVLKWARDRGITVPKTAVREAEQDYLRDYEGAEDVLRQMGHDPAHWRSGLRDRLTLRMAIEEILRGVRVERSETVAYFLEHRELFVRQREVRVRQIVVARATEATEIARRLKKGEDFGRLAREHSLSPEAAEGGELGFLRPGQMPPELEDVVFSLEVGKLSEVIPTTYGFHIVQVADEVPARELGYSEVEGEIRRRLLGAAAQRRYETWLQAQWDDARIQIMDPKLGNTEEEGERRS
jgi:parvulin-like peptidyl-prolyl isomerase